MNIAEPDSLANCSSGDEEALRLDYRCKLQYSHMMKERVSSLRLRLYKAI